MASCSQTKEEKHTSKLHQSTRIKVEVRADFVCSTELANAQAYWEGTGAVLEAHSLRLASSSVVERLSSWPSTCSWIALYTFLSHSCARAKHFKLECGADEAICLIPLSKIFLSSESKNETGSVNPRLILEGL